MSFINENAFRILGLSTNSSKRMIEQRLDELEAYKVIGQYPKYESDIDFLDKFNRDEKLIDSSRNVVKDKKLNLLHSLFWFSNTDPVDNMAINFINNKKFDMAVPLWKNYVSEFKSGVENEITPSPKSGESSIDLSDTEWESRCLWEEPHDVTENTLKFEFGGNLLRLADGKWSEPMGEWVSNGNKVKFDMNEKYSSYDTVIDINSNTITGTSKNINDDTGTVSLKLIKTSDSYEKSKKAFLGKSDKKKKKVESKDSQLSDNSFHHVKNLALLYMIIALNSKNRAIKNKVKGKAADVFKNPQKMLLHSLDLWNQLINSSYFNDMFIKDFDNVNQEDYLSALLDIIQGAISTPGKKDSKTFIKPDELFIHTAKYDGIMSDVLRKRYLAPHTYIIESSIKKFKTAKEKEKSRQDLLAINLIKDIKSEVDIIKSACSYDISKCQTICDDLAQELLLAAIETWNNNAVKENDKFDKNIKSIQTSAMSIAVSDFVRDKIQSNSDELPKLLKANKDFDSLEPIAKLMGKYEELIEDDPYYVGKIFAYKLRPLREKVEDTIGSKNENYQLAMRNCGHILRSASIKLNNKSEYGKSIEMVDFARRLMWISNDDEGISMLESDRDFVVKNNNNDGGLFVMVLGGGIRETKKSMKCGCNSNLSLQECCSMGRK